MGEGWRMGFGPVVSAEWLRQHLDDADVVVVDIRWYIDGRPGMDGYLERHIPGAVYVDHDTEITNPGRGGGRHPLPEREQFQRAMRRCGVNQKSKVVVYDEQGGFVAARLWWTLRYFGHLDVAILDGGMPAWGGPWTSEPTDALPSDFIATEPQTQLAVDYAQVRALAAETVLLDARPPERYRGDQEPVDPKPGHIPGARNVPWEANVDEHGLLRSARALRELYQAVGVNDAERVVAYCGSGARACHVILALQVAGLPGAKLYPGSWSDWCAHGDAPIATGSE